MVTKKKTDNSLVKHLFLNHNLIFKLGVNKTDDRLIVFEIWFDFNLS